MCHSDDLIPSSDFTQVGNQFFSKLCYNIKGKESSFKHFVSSAIFEEYIFVAGGYNLCPSPD